MRPLAMLKTEHLTFWSKWKNQSLPSIRLSRCLHPFLSIHLVLLNRPFIRVTVHPLSVCLSSIYLPPCLLSFNSLSTKYQVRAHILSFSLCGAVTVADHTQSQTLVTAINDTVILSSENRTQGTVKQDRVAHFDLLPVANLDAWLLCARDWRNHSEGVLG